MANFDFTAIAKQFVEFYYQTFDNGRAGLAPLYRETSMLTFEGSTTQGGQNIIEKLAGLPFQKVQHQVSTLDAQPTILPGGIAVMVTGALLTDDEAKPLSFTQMFQLVLDNGTYYVYNDVFRLVY
ncbi:putative nuclear transport factor NTF-2 [Trichodelitschia bisporula]|uniref:Nuclear transport factor 2 n=1 Tax=Trichodelitschia bisporula TaxID=703511 RepID=A0A6G1HK74_9PEZI|nr:putative nuclear transport factor NTF-2 [Trichodelitschia bisporula]